VVLECGELEQTRYLQAGTGFLGQHSKELCFGLGKTTGEAKVTVRWPSGAVQRFEALPRNQRIELEEGTATFTTKPYATVPAAYMEATVHAAVPTETLPRDVETWLISPLRAPGFALKDTLGTEHSLREFAGNPVLLHFWASTAPRCREVLRHLHEHKAALDGSRLKVVGVNVDEAADIASARKLIADEHVLFPVLFATEEIAGIYNIIFRYLFDRRRDLALPTSFLLDADGMIVKVYQGSVDATGIARDAKSTGTSAEAQRRRALPFHGDLQQGTFQRNDFTYGVALFQHSYLAQAVDSFEQVLRARPNDPEAYYNLGTLKLRMNDFTQARSYLEKTLELRPNYPEAWNNLGMMSAQSGNAVAAIESFGKALEQRPNYEIALMNLGNVYRRQGQFAKAEECLGKALAIQPDDPEVNYNLGMLHAQQNDLSKASEYLQRAIALRPSYSEALNNLGIVYVRLQDMNKAEMMFKTGIEVAPDNEQAYLNMARLDVIKNDKRAAREVLEELLARQPGNAAAMTAMDVLR
jgi:tetratricopeptide (TPR) repeat protein/peroxiredoxin